VFALIAQGGVEELEMRRTFNMGLGMLVCVEAGAADRALTVLAESGEQAAVVGQVITRDGDDRVVFG
jgi:phosphoribosylformylglycinamidine cyclo-ligase